MSRFSKMVFSNGENNITIVPMIKGIKNIGYRITEENLAYYHRGGILPQASEFEVVDFKDVENYITQKKKEGYKQL